MHNYADEVIRVVFLENITFRNFRNYELLDLHFYNKMNLVIGGNAQGKTNILEGIYFLSTAKSHRTSQDNELIQHEKKWFYIKGSVLSVNSSTVVEIINTFDDKKRIKINGKSQGRISDVIGKINTVMFSPEDLSLIKGAPSDRRRFLDILISRINPPYLRLLGEYQSTLKQRNELLKRIRDNKLHGLKLDDSLDSWNKLLVEFGSAIIKQRISAISELSSIASEMHKKLTESHEELKIEYQSELVTKEEKNSDVSGRFVDNLRKSIDSDIRQGITSIGPHRDDLVFTIDSLDARKFCSQGQQRTGVLALKLANLELTNSKIGEYPIILLDDVTSEIDEKRVSFLFELLSNIPVQTFLTTTNLNNGLLKKYLHSSNDDYDVFLVDNGKVEKLALKLDSLDL